MTGEHRNGEMFDHRYRLERRIGTGGMADVYLASDGSLERRVAIKILADRYTRDEGFIERFRREARSAAGLNHPNIVSIYDRGESEGESYIAMEYVDGETLKDEINAHAPLPEAEAILYSQQALSALEFAHQRGIVHRDVKPHNMLIGSDGVLKVADFGIARAQNTAEMTEVGSIVGTAQYLSPEQARGQAVGPQSDIYSMGIVLYEMLTGELPFTGTSAVEIAMKQVNEDPVPPSRRNRLVSRPLEQVVLRALAKDPALRFQSAREMADELERVRRGLAVSQSTQQATMVMAAPTRVMPVVPPPGEEPPAEQPKRSALPWLLVALLLLAAAGVGFLVYRQLQSDQVTVPKVIGFTAASARQTLQEKGFVVASKPSSSSPDNKGLVVKQDPTSSTKADKGSTVTIFVGQGPASIQLPKLAGKTLNAAISTVISAGLPAPVTIAKASTLAANTVISSSPGPGPVPPTTVVKIYYSSGQVSVPVVHGLSYDGAASRIESAGLTPSRVDQSSDTIPAGQVIGTDPAEGTTVVSGSTVQVFVSTGQAQVPVPGVVGEDVDQARSDLHDAGLKPNVTKCLGPVGDPRRPGRQAGPGRRDDGRPEVQRHHLRRRPGPDDGLPGVSGARRVRVAVLYGGRSSEHEISVLSGRSVIEALDPDRYDVVPVQIGRSGGWELEAAGALQLEPGAEGRSLVPRPGASPVPAGAGPIDVVLPVLHGPFGEDGTVQGLLEMLDLPYVGSGVLGSAVTMDKEAVKLMLRGAEIPVARHVSFSHRRWDAERASSLGFPCFVKPANLGSSVGISKVHGPEELQAAMELAFRHDWLVLVEEMIEGREVELGVLGNADADRQRPRRDPDRQRLGVVRLLGEVRRGRHDAGRACRPARRGDGGAPGHRAAGVRDLPLRRHGPHRLLRTPQGGVVLNEINTIPGFTATSVYARLFEASGIPYRELLDRLIELALDRHRDERSYER